MRFPTYWAKRCRRAEVQVRDLSRQLKIANEQTG